MSNQETTSAVQRDSAGLGLSQTHTHKHTQTHTHTTNFPLNVKAKDPHFELEKAEQRTEHSLPE